MGEKNHERLGFSNDADSASQPSVLATRKNSATSESRSTFPSWDLSFFARFCDAGF
jgi:hypothetical protein